MFKGLIRTMASLTGNFTLCCNINNIKQIDSNTFGCFVKSANMLPLQPNLYSSNINVDLLNGNYPNDVGRFYNEYKDFFFKENFNYSKNNYQEFYPHKNNYNRNSYYELGCSRLNINKYQFIFFAPFYFDDITSLPQEFIITIHLGDTVEKKIKVYINQESNHNILKYYLEKYAKNLTNTFVYLSNIYDYGIYYGIDVKNGSLCDYKNVHIGRIFNEYLSRYDVDEIINNGFQQMNMICRQIIPLSFAFNVEDILTPQELNFFRYSRIKISGYWANNDINLPFYDFDINYTIENDKLATDDIALSNIIQLHKSSNKVDKSFYNFYEDKNVKYKYTNKITLNFSKWKLSSTTDDVPYVINQSFLYSNIDNVINYYHFPSLFYPKCIIENESLCVPITNTYAQMYSTSDWYNAYINNVSNWFRTIHVNDSIEDYANISYYWSNVVNNECMYKHILYNNLDCNKFGVFVKVNLNTIDKYNDISKCEILYSKTNSENEPNVHLRNDELIYNNDINNLSLFNFYVQQGYDSIYPDEEASEEKKFDLTKYKFNEQDPDIFINSSQNNIYCENDIILEKNNIEGDIIEFNDYTNKWIKVSQNFVIENFPEYKEYLSTRQNNKDIESYEIVNNDDLKEYIFDALKKGSSINDLLEMDKKHEKVTSSNIHLSKKSTSLVFPLLGKTPDELKKYAADKDMYDIFISCSYIPLSNISLVYKIYNKALSEYRYRTHREGQENRGIASVIDISKTYSYIPFYRNSNSINANYFQEIKCNPELYFIFFNFNMFKDYKDIIEPCCININDPKILQLYKNLKELYVTSFNNENNTNFLQELCDEWNKKYCENTDVSFSLPVQRTYNENIKIIPDTILELFTVYEDIQQNIETYSFKSNSEGIFNFNHGLVYVFDQKLNEKHNNLYAVFPVIKLTDKTIDIFNEVVKYIEKGAYAEMNQNNFDYSSIYQHYNMYICTIDDYKRIGVGQKSQSLGNNISGECYVPFGNIIDSNNLSDNELAYKYQTNIMSILSKPNKTKNNTSYIYNKSLNYKKQCIQLKSNEIKYIKKTYIRLACEFILSYWLCKDFNGDNVDAESFYSYARSNSNAAAEMSSNIAYTIDTIIKMGFMTTSYLKDMLTNIFIDSEHIEITYDVIHNNTLFNVQIPTNNILTKYDIINIINTNKYDDSETGKIDYDLFIDNLINCVYDKMNDRTCSDYVYNFINGYIDYYNEINKYNTGDTIFNTENYIPSIPHLKFYKSYNINKIKYDDVSFTYNNEKYRGIIINLYINSSYVSFNVDKGDTIYQIFYKVNGTELNNENIVQYFKYMYPYLSVNVFGNFLNTYKSIICIPRSLNISPNKITNTLILSNSDFLSKYADSMNSDIIYKTSNINSSIYNININRYFSNISPIFVPIGQITNKFYLKFRTNKNDLMNEDNMYNVDYFNINHNINIRQYNSNSYTEFEQIEEKSFNYNTYYLIPNNIEIIFNKKFTYNEILEYENDEVVQNEFIKYLDKKSNDKIEDIDTKLFLYNKYKVQFISEVVDTNHATNEKLYSLKYLFTLYND